MAYKEVSRVGIVEVIRHWQRGNSQPEDLLTPWGDQVYQWLSVDRLQMTRIQELMAERGCCVSYNSLRRFILKRNWLRRNPRTVRIGKNPPGEVAEFDFGRLGYICDPESGCRRTVWALIVVQAHSRHSFVWPTYSQRLGEVVADMEAAWKFFDGIPKYLGFDNFPAAVAGTDALHPRLTWGFLEYSQHRGFITDLARVRYPKDKPRVERGIRYVRERFFKGGEFRDLAHLRYEAIRWCRDVAGQRIHDTIRRKPLGRRALRDHPLAHRQGSPRSARGLPQPPLPQHRFRRGGACPTRACWCRWTAATTPG